jgi:hypothetical protein
MLTTHKAYAQAGEQVIHTEYGCKYCIIKEQKVVIRFMGYWNIALNWLAKKKQGRLWTSKWY